MEVERVVDLHAAAILGRGEADPVDHVGDAARHLAVEARAARGPDRAVGRDEERHDDVALEAGMREQLALVAVADLLLLALDVALDDRLVEITDQGRRQDVDRRDQLGVAGQARTVAGAGARPQPTSLPGLVPIVW